MGAGFWRASIWVSKAQQSSQPSSLQQPQAQAFCHCQMPQAPCSMPLHLGRSAQCIWKSGGLETWKCATVRRWQRPAHVQKGQSVCSNTNGRYKESEACLHCAVWALRQEHQRLQGLRGVCDQVQSGPLRTKVGQQSARCTLLTH